MIQTSLKYLLLISFIAFSTSCGKSKEQEIIDAVTSANIYLSTKQCQPAIDLLEGLGRQTSNAKYLKALSSAYACRAGYSTTVFFGTDVSKTASPSPLGGMTKYTTSLVTATSPLISDYKFEDLQKAIDILLYAGGIPSSTEPSATARTRYFSSNVAGDINAQLVFMTLAQLGKLMKIYSDADASGVKGGGSAGNNCFTDYSAAGIPAAVKLYITSGGQTGACTSTTSSHTQLSTGASNRRARLCQGVVLMNVILDVLPNVLATAGGGDLSDIATVTQDINDYKDDLITYYPSIGTTATVMSQSNCETDSAITEDTLSSYYAVVFESLVH